VIDVTSIIRENLSVLISGGETAATQWC